YARIAQGEHERLARENRMAPAALLGAGNLVMTLDMGEGKTAYQGVVQLEGATLAACAETFFRVSEQTDTQIRLAVGEVTEREGPASWRAGGVLMQRIAADAARGDTAEDWNRASILFATLRDEELVDPGLSTERMLYQ